MFLIFILFKISPQSFGVFGVFCVVRLHPITAKQQMAELQTLQCLHFFIVVITFSKRCNVSLPLCLLQVRKTYSNGTYRAGPMRQISLVGAVDEEVGNYFPEFLGMLGDSPFLQVRRDGDRGATRIIQK